MNNIGEQLKARRFELGISQQTLADLSEVSINTIVGIERGTGNPSLRTLEKLCHVLGVALTLTPGRGLN